MFEEGWGEFFGDSTESMAVLGGWCLGGGERGERSGEFTFNSIARGMAPKGVKPQTNRPPKSHARDRQELSAVP